MADNTPVCSFAMAHIKCTICKHVNVQPDKSMQMCSGRGCAEWASTCDLKGTGAWAFEAWKKNGEIRWRGTLLRRERARLLLLPGLCVLRGPSPPARRGRARFRRSWLRPPSGEGVAPVGSLRRLTCCPLLRGHNAAPCVSSAPTASSRL